MVKILYLATLRSLKSPISTLSLNLLTLYYSNVNLVDIYQFGEVGGILGDLGGLGGLGGLGSLGGLGGLGGQGNEFLDISIGVINPLEYLGSSSAFRRYLAPFLGPFNQDPVFFLRRVFIYPFKRVEYRYRLGGKRLFLIVQLFSLFYKGFLFRYILAYLLGLVVWGDSPWNCLICDYRVLYIDPKGVQGPLFLPQPGHGCQCLLQDRVLFPYSPSDFLDRGVCPDSIGDYRVVSCVYRRMDSVQPAYIL